MATIADELLNDFEDSGGEEDQDQDQDQDEDRDQYHGLGQRQKQQRGEEIDVDGDTRFSGLDDRITRKPAADLRRYRSHGAASLDGDDAEGYVDGDGDGDEEAMDVTGPDGGRDTAPGNFGAEDAEETKARVEKMELKTVSDVRSVAGLMKLLKPVLENIEYYKNLPPDKQTVNVGNVEDNPEYKLLTTSNTLSTNIDGEIILVHKFIRDHYSVRFPELETLIQNPLEYAKTVAIIGNGPMENIRAISESKDNIVGQSLRQVLDGPSLMVVTVEATTTSGTALSEDELATVRRACEMVLQLDRAKKILTEYVQSRMSIFAPNLTTLIGSLTAAQLLNYAGGITGLAKTPSCNIAPLGSKKNTSAIGLASNTGVRHQGFLYNNEIIRDVPSDLKTQAMRILAAKVVLAARVDQAHESPAGEQGLAFYDQVEKRIAKLSEAPPNKGVKALPAPDDKPARKRGGRRARKAKEATAVTDLRKAQNRMAFGEEEAEVGFGDSVKGLGMIGKQDSGRVRAQQIDQRTKAKLSKKNAGWGAATPAGSGTATSLRSFNGGGPLGSLSSFKSAGLRTSGVGASSGLKTNIGNMGGTTSTIAFTPVQGLELVDPKVRAEMNRKRAADEDRWFKGGTFTQIAALNGSSATPAAGGKIDSAGFKVPGLPPSKRAKNEG